MYAQWIVFDISLQYDFLNIYLSTALTIHNCFEQGNLGFKEYENFLCNVTFAELTALSLIAWNQFNELEEIFLEDEVFAYI